MRYLYYLYTNDDTKHVIPLTFLSLACSALTGAAWALSEPAWIATGITALVFALATISELIYLYSNYLENRDDN